jgi:hypothetical protein
MAPTQKINPAFHSTRLEMVINLKTAKALGLEVPPMTIVAARSIRDEPEGRSTRTGFDASRR